jgi:hypothetical protein
MSSRFGMGGSSSRLECVVNKECLKAPFTLVYHGNVEKGYRFQDHEVYHNFKVRGRKFNQNRKMEGR